MLTKEVSTPHCSPAKRLKTLTTPLTKGVYQQTTSCLSRTNQDCYELEGGCHAVYGFEYKPGLETNRMNGFVGANSHYSFDDGYITWINDDKAVWTITSDGMGRDDRTEIGPRPIPQEPMVSE